MNMTQQLPFYPQSPCLVKLYTSDDKHFLNYRSHFVFAKKYRKTLQKPSLRTYCLRAQACEAFPNILWRYQFAPS